MAIPALTRFLTRLGTFYDIWVERIGRLFRPLMLLGVIGLFVWPIFQPNQFTQWCAAIRLLPDDMWLVIFLVIGSWATTKAVRDWRQ